MAHRDKRPRVGNPQESIFSPEVDASSIGPTSAPLAKVPEESPIAACENPEITPATMEETRSLPINFDFVGIPDKSTWKGWAEIENDPVRCILSVQAAFSNSPQLIFNVMLREWGVRGIRVNEVVPLDAIFDSSSEPISGLIFLSRYNSTEKKNAKTQIPQGLWFANQVCIVLLCTVGGISGHSIS
jgi:Ubiquitin carboxyl-terminal hydrolase, family 1